MADISFGRERETELKFTGGPECQARLSSALGMPSREALLHACAELFRFTRHTLEYSRRLRLRDRYFDTQWQTYHERGDSLRVRLEGGTRTLAFKHQREIDKGTFDRDEISPKGLDGVRDRRSEFALLRSLQHKAHRSSEIGVCFWVRIPSQQVRQGSGSGH